MKWVFHLEALLQMREVWIFVLKIINCSVEFGVLVDITNIKVKIELEILFFLRKA